MNDIKIVLWGRNITHVRKWFRHIVLQSFKTQNICITFVQCWTNVKDVGPTLYKCYANVLCLLSDPFLAEVNGIYK